MDFKNSFWKQYVWSLAISTSGFSLSKAFDKYIKTAPLQLFLINEIPNFSTSNFNACVILYPFPQPQKQGDKNELN